METGQGVGLEELSPSVQWKMAGAVECYLRQERSSEAKDQLELFRLLEQFYRYGLEDRDA